MKKNKNKGFTLVELIAVLVIMALIALIVTPLVMNIVKKAKHSANERSVDAYGKALELSVATYLLDTKVYPTSLEGLKVEYAGTEVNCLVKKLNEDGSIYLSECSVGGIEVKDSTTEDGYYHYGKTSGSYKSYKVGDVISYNGMKFYVIEASDENDGKVTMLKETPLTVSEVTQYAIDESGVNRVNRYTISSIGNVYNQKGYGGMAYYSSATCGSPVPGGPIVDSGCALENAVSYEASDVKYIVDAWANDKLNVSDLSEDKLGYSVRLITLDEMISNLGYEKENGVSNTNFDTTNVPSWMSISDSGYWTMSQYQDSTSKLWVVWDTDVYNSGVETVNGIVRPVITLSKNAI